MNIKEQLQRDEGTLLHVYQDHLGYWTIGTGFLVDQRKGGGLRPEENDFILKNRIRVTTEALEKALPWVKDLDEARKAVLINMSYQMGVKGVLGFKNTLEMIRKGQYEEAADGMLQSLWAKQTPNRALRLSEQMRTGVWK